MKKILVLMLFCLALLSGCGAKTEPLPETEPAEIQMQTGNPWKDYDSMEAAETACGLDFPLPDGVDNYSAEAYRVMNGQLMEVMYRLGDDKIVVRMSSGEGQDLSGVFETVTGTEVSELNGYSVTHQQLTGGSLHLISGKGFSYSLYAPNGYQYEADQVFLSLICKP